MQILIFCKFKKDKKLGFNFSANFKRLKNYEFNFCKLKTAAKTCISFSASLQKLKKHAFILFSGVEKLKNYGDISFQA